jgi:thiamine-monophosphate kinase
MTFEPRVFLAREIAKKKRATAMMDLSDGLAGDATHLAAASGVAIDVDLERVPVAPDVAAVAARLGMPPTAFAAQGGEDYELLAALPPDFGEDGARRFRAEVGLALTRVGAARAGTGVRLLSGGAEVALRGYDHFA